MSKPVTFNGRTWRVTALAEDAVLFTLDEQKDDNLDVITGVESQVERSAIAGITDLVASYNSIAVFFDSRQHSHLSVLDGIAAMKFEEETRVKEGKIIKIPVCYDLGLDWNEVLVQTGLSRETYIKRHTEREYSLALVGFMPGFAYLKGMDKSLSCSRKDSPRTRVPAGSIGVAGEFTGMYSFSSPGGWQIIGRTPVSLFDETKMPPLIIGREDRLRFYPISRNEFEDYE